MSIINYMPQKEKTDLNRIIEEYYAYAGENISAGDFVEFVKGIAEQKTVIYSPTNLQCNTTNGWDYEAALLSENKIIMAYYAYYGNDTTQYLKVRILTIEDNKIILGTEYVLSDFVVYNILIEVLTPNRAIISYRRTEEEYNNEGYIILINISDNGVVTSGTNVGKVTYMYYLGNIELCKISDTSVLLLYKDDASDHAPIVRVATVNTEQNKIIIGGLTNLVTFGCTPYVSQLKENSIVVIYDKESAADLLAKILTISGTTISVGSTKTLFSSGGNWCQGILTLASDKILVKYVDDSGDESVECFMVCTISSSGSFTKGTALTGISFDGDINTLVKVDDNTAISIYSRTYTFLGINGTTLTTISSNSLPTDVNSYSGTMIHMVAPDRLFLVTDVSAYFSGRVFIVDKDNGNLLTQITTDIYETQVKKATQNPFDGVAKTAGTGGTVTAHKDEISVWVPNI